MKNSKTTKMKKTNSKTSRTRTIKIGEHKHDLLDAVRLGKKVYIIVRAFTLKVAYELVSGSEVKFFGYVGTNGPSAHRLKKAVTLGPSVLSKLYGKKFQDA